MTNNDNTESTPTANGPESGVSGVLAAHGLIYEPRCYPAFECECGWHGAIGDDGGPSDGTRDNADAWRAHVAEHLAAIVREHTGRALAEVVEDIRARRREFARLGAHDQYLMAMDDAFGLANNRYRAARQEQDHD